MIRYKTIIKDLLSKDITFYKVTVNDFADNYHNSFFNKYCIVIPKYCNQPTRLSKFFQYYEDFTNEDLKDYKNFPNYVNIDVDKLMFILGVKEFYLKNSRKRKAHNHYCLKCNSFTNEYYVKKHVNDKHSDNVNTVTLSIKDAFKKIGEVCVSNVTEDKVMMKCFNRAIQFIK